MELFPTQSNIVGRNSIYGNVISETQMVAMCITFPFPMILAQLAFVTMTVEGFSNCLIATVSQ